MNLSDQQSDTFRLVSELMTRMANELFPLRDNQDFSVIATPIPNRPEMQIASWLTIDGQQFVTRREFAPKPTTVCLYAGCVDQIMALGNSVREYLVVDGEEDTFPENWPSDLGFLVDDDTVTGAFLDDDDFPDTGEDACYGDCSPPERHGDDSFIDDWEN